MNLAIRGIGFNLGKERVDTFTQDQHPDLKADYVLANPPFNVSDWWSAKLEGDKRWAFGTPPAGNANYAWLSSTSSGTSSPPDRPGWCWPTAP